jgi:translocation and assembly module TamB
MNVNAPSEHPERPRDPAPRRRYRRLIRAAAWFYAISTAFFLLMIIVVTILLHSTAFHGYVLRTAQKQAQQTLGVRVQIQNYALDLSNLRLDVYGVTVDGASPYASPPLLQVRHALASVRVVSILQRKWYLDEIRIDQPVVQLFVDKNGHSNIPTIKSSGSNSSTSIFDLGIRRAVLDHGEVYYNNQPVPLAADLHDVDFHSVFKEATSQYSGKLTYTNSRIVYGTFQPFAHDLEVQFDATPDTFHLSPVRISSGASHIVLSATAIHYSTSPSVQATYEVVADGQQLARLLNNASLPAGLVRASGSAQYQPAANQPLLQALVVNGDLTSPQLLVKTNSVSAAVSEIAAHYTLKNGDATLRDFRARMLGGIITAQGIMKDIGGNSRSEATAKVRGVSLVEARKMLGASAASRNVSFAGELNADARATWGKTFTDLIAKADATITGRAVGTYEAGQADAPGAIPVESALHATYTAANQQLGLADSYVRTPQTSLNMNGVISKRSRLALRLQANDLREVAAIANMFRPPEPNGSSQPLDLAGSASFEGNVQGSISAPHLTGQLSASNLHLNGTDWRAFHTGIEASPSMASLQHADLEGPARGRATFNASAGLANWSFANTSPIQLELNASQINVAALTKFTGQEIPVTGTLNAHVSLHGTALNPEGSGRAVVTKIVAYEEPIDSVNVDFNGSGGEAHANLSVQLPAGTLQGKVSVRPREKTYTAQLTSEGIRLDQLQNLKTRSIDATGIVSLHADGQGTLDNPHLNATIQIPSLVIEKQTLEKINLQLNMADHVANATLSSSALQSSIQANARVDLTGNYPADASLDTQGIPLQPLIAAYAPDEADSVTGETELHATLHGPLKNKNLLEAHATIPYLRLAYASNIQLAAAAPIQINYKNNVVNVQRSAIRGTETNLEFQGSIPVAGDAPMSLLLQGTVNLRVAQLFNPDVRSSGELRFNINSNGAGPNIGGQIDIVDASYASNGLPVGLQHGNGVLTLTNNRINVSKFEGTVGGGKLTAQGGVAYRPAIQFDLGLSARDIRMLYPQGMRESINANLRLAGTTDNANLGGTVNVTDLSFTPAFDLSSFVSQFSGVATPPSRGISQNIQLNIAVRSTNNVNLVSRTLSIGGSANLQVRGTAAEPVILGRVILNNGDVLLNGNRFLLNSGTVQFVNPSQTQPVVNLSLNTTIQQYNIALQFRGPVDQLQTQYTSDPALPQADIINLLAFGRTTEAAAADTTTTNQAAQSLVASQVTSQVTSRVSRIAGISQLSINPILANPNSQTTPGASITIQQRVAGNLFVTFTSNFATTQGQTISGQYKVSPRVGINVTGDPNGGFAIDTTIKKTW